MTMHVDNWNPDTYLWILQEVDVPYIPEEWNKLMATFAKPGTKLTGASILGRYLSKMKLKQFKDFRWADTERLQELANHRIEETMKRQGYDAVEIAEVIQKGTFEIPDKPLEQPVYAAEEEEFVETNEDYFSSNAYGNYTEDIGLTEEDIISLRLKWGKSYKPEEWV